MLDTIVQICLDIAVFGLKAAVVLGILDIVSTAVLLFAGEDPDRLSGK